MKFKINAQFQSMWHIGTGRGSGQNLDALVEKDASGLPYVSGKTLKGLFRDAFYKLDTWQDSSHTDELFGTRTATTEQTRDNTQAGILRFNNLELIEKDYLQAHKDLIPHLFKTHASTAIEFETGSAKEKSLRIMEVAIPVGLHGEISILPNNKNYSPEAVLEHLQQAASLITHIGANKNRGFGRVIVEVSA